ncbi:hypothetical protein C5167_035338, partial [Papaver somniferum]
ASSIPKIIPPRLFHFLFLSFSRIMAFDVDDHEQQQQKHRRMTISTLTTCICWGIIVWRVDANGASLFCLSLQFHPQNCSNAEIRQIWQKPATKGSPKKPIRDNQRSGCGLEFTIEDGRPRCLIYNDIWQVTKRSQVERRAQVKDQRSNAICEVDLHEVEKLQVHNLMEIAQLAWQSGRPIMS